jgi:hypothetical protein
MLPRQHLVAALGFESGMIPKDNDGKLGSIFAGRAAYRSAEALELWLPEERNRHSAQAQYAGIEDASRYHGVPR